MGGCQISRKSVTEVTVQRYGEVGVGGSNVQNLFYKSMVQYYLRYMSRWRVSNFQKKVSQRCTVISVMGGGCGSNFQKKEPRNTRMAPI